ncbi:hypothetical protein Pla175_02930 [Pirellulimonas nuda]|uniref:Uncharacterized protein n=1 Tax=Pirellulimonas nuda TaxID=2528009 RepID=A0A518D657_9BACT|nr:hypothetical protein [Pirellulimonas nuda]QDU86939.1 hypothetical protein Pla175_02930 [Pirellulimonas nuda]
MARNAISNDRYRLVGAYDRLRRTLVDQHDDGRLDRALSFWVLPSDRRLPIAFLDRTLRELLSHPLEELMATPGVGQKKILGLFDLLRRAAKGGSGYAPFGLKTPIKALEDEPVVGAGFDAATVSEAVWSTWCDTVRRTCLRDEPLGRVAPSLQALPTVIWHTPLSTYSDRTLAQIRRLRTHGEKRVQAVLEVFCTVHEALSTAVQHENLDLVVTPRFVPRVCHWLNQVVWQPELPSAEELHRALAMPLIKQIEIDLGPQIGKLAADRLSLTAGAPTVKDQADSLGVTRARVYQLLEDCAKAMDVRWPEGRWLLTPLANKLGRSSPESMGLLHAIRELFFPDDRPLRPDPTKLEE